MDSKDKREQANEIIDTYPPTSTDVVQAQPMSLSLGVAQGEAGEQQKAAMNEPVGIYPQDSSEPVAANPMPE